MLLGKFVPILAVLCCIVLQTEANGQKNLPPKIYSPAKSSIVIDFFNKQKVVFSEKPDAVRHPASLTKMMTLYLLFEALRSGKIKLDTKFKVSKLATMQKPSKLGLKVGEKIKVIDIIKALLVKSANDVAVVAAEGISGNVKSFVTAMNKKAKQLGMRHTHFENPSGLPNKLQITSARDIATLGIALFKYFPQYWHYFKMKSFQYNEIIYPTHCKILKWYRGTDGAKTGYIWASGFNLFVTAQKYNKEGNSKRLFIVVIGGNDSKSRDIYAAQLMDKFFGNYKIAIQNIKAGKNKKNIKNPNKALLEQIDKTKPSQIEEIIEENEEITITKILDYSSDETRAIDELYIDDEEFLDGSVKIIEETSVK